LVALTSANKFTLDLWDDGVVKIAVGTQILDQVIDHQTGKLLKDLVSDNGMIEAPGRQVALSVARTWLAPG